MKLSPIYGGRFLETLPRRCVRLAGFTGGVFNIRFNASSKLRGWSETGLSSSRRGMKLELQLFRFTGAMQKQPQFGRFSILIERRERCRDSFDC
jgi:hypothetical protein